MKLFNWTANVGDKCIADGYLLAENRAEAEEKLKLVPFHDRHEEVILDNDGCDYYGIEINENGVAIRWEE